MLSPTLMKLIFIPDIFSLRKYNGIVLGYYQFWKALNKVPAYRNLLDNKNFARPKICNFVPILTDVPFTSKENYVTEYSIEERCINGKIPDKEVIIDESSGSSGKPTNWVRGKIERVNNAKMIQLGIQSLYPNEPLFVINAFALGPWATGVNVTMSCVKFSKLKSLGPDTLKIINTLKQFGSGHHYIIMGYPPFLKSLIESKKIEWREFNITLIFGGESMIEGMRTYLKTLGIKAIYSSYGASDIELNMAFESDFTISLRRLLIKNSRLKSKLIKYDGAMPMIFQYNPTDFLFEENELGELVITICRDGYISPKIRYNIHDIGYSLELKEVYNAMDDLGIDSNLLIRPKTDLPILFHFGRIGNVVSFYGANISPDDVQEAIYMVPNMATLVHSFFIKVNEDETGSKQLEIIFELNESITRDVKLIEMYTFFDALASVNQDFREAKRMVKNNSELKITYEMYKSTIFSDADIRIKLKYL